MFRSMIVFLGICLLISFFCLPTFCQQAYMKPKFFDFDKIRIEEQLKQNTNVARVYVCLAVRENNGFNFFAGRFNLKEDKKTLEKDINNLGEYKKIGHLEKDVKVQNNQHICYITSMPKFEELFPDEFIPIDENQMVEVLTKPDPENNLSFVGAKSMPLFTTQGKNTGLERFFAFYNLKPPDAAPAAIAQPTAPPPPPPDPKTNVLSYGFIEIKFENK